MPITQISAPKIDGSTSFNLETAIATLSNGNYVVSYINFDDSRAVVFSEVFDPQGNLVGAGQTQRFDGESADGAQIVALAGGGYAVTFDNFPDVRTVVFDAQAQRVSNEAVASSNPPASSSVVDSMTALPNGGYVVASETFTQQGGDVFATIFDAQGLKVAGPINVSNTPNFQDADMHVAALPNGHVAMVWEGVISRGDNDSEMFTAVLDGQGQLVAPPVDVSQTPGAGFGDSQPSLAVLSNGDYAMSWTGETAVGGLEIYTAVFDGLGNQVAAAEPIALGEEGHITGLANGNYAISWDAGDSVSTAVFDTQGHQLSPSFGVINAAGLTLVDQMATLSNGDYAIAYDVKTSDASAELFVAVFDPQGHELTAPLDVGSFFGGTLKMTALANGAFGLSWIGPGNGIAGFTYTATYQFTDGTTVGDTSVIGSPDIAVDLSAIFNAGGNVIVTNNGAAVIIDLHNLASVGGNFVLSDNGAVLTITLPHLTEVSGSVGIDGNTAATTISAGQLQTVGGGIDISGDTSATTIDVSSLTVVGGGIDVDGNTAATTVDLGSLQTSGGPVDVSGNTAATTVDLGSLQASGGPVDVSGNTAATTVDIGSLQTSGGPVNVSGNTAATAVDLGSLQTSGGSVNVSGNTSAITINLGALISAGAIIIDNNGVITLNLSALTHVGGDVELVNNSHLLTVDMPHLTSVDGSVNVSGNTSATAIDLGSLQTSGGSVNVSGNTSATEIDFSSLQTAGGSVSADGDTAATTIDFGSLTQAGGSVSAINDGTSSTIDFGELDSVGGDVTVDVGSDATAVDASALGPGGGTILLTGSSNGPTGLVLGSLAHMLGTLHVTGANGVTVSADAGLADITTTGTDGNDTVTGSATASNTMDGGGGNDNLTGGAANDTISGGAGNDTLTGDDGNDAVSGGTGDDTLVGGHGAGDDVYDGGPGIDTVTFTSAPHAITVDLNEIDRSAHATLGGTTIGQLLVNAGKAATTPAGLSEGIDIGSDALISIENVVGGQGGDTITGSVADNVITGGAGNDILDGGAGTDTSVYSGNRSDYTFIQNADGSLTVTDKRANAPDGTDTLRNFELLKFADGTAAISDVLPPPVITSNGGADSASVSVGENTTAVTHVTASDPNVGQALAFAITGGADAAKFQIDPATGALAFVAAPNFEAPADAGANNVYDVVVQVADGFHFDSQALAVTVTDVNEAPTLDSQTANQSATAGTPFLLTLPAGTFQDADSGDHLTLAATLSDGSALPSWLSFNAATAKFSGTPGAGDADSFHVKVTATDSGGLSAFETFQMAVNAAAALAGQVILTTATEHMALASGTTVATFTDSNLSDTVSAFTASIDWGDGTTTAGVVTGSNGSFTVLGGHTYADEGSDLVTATITRSADHTQISLAGTVTVADHDVLTPHGVTINASSNQPFTGTVATFSDIDTISGAGDFAATIDWGDGTATVGTVTGGNGAFTVSGTHVYTAAGQDAVTVTLSEAAPGTTAVTASSTANVGVSQHAPVITSDGGGNTASIIVTDDSRYVATVHATDPDPGTTIKYSIAGGADQKLLTIDPKTGVLSFKSDPRDGHDYQVTVAASDGNLQDTQTIKVHVAEGPFESGNPGVSDQFVFTPHFGLAIVNNFDPTSSNHDVLELDHSLFQHANVNESAAQVLALVENHSFQFGHDLIILTDTHDLIDLRNVQQHQLSPGDILLV